MSGPFNIDERLNKSDKATQAAAETGTDDTQWMSSEKTHSAFKQYGVGAAGLADADTAKITNIDDTKTPSGVYAFFSAYTTEGERPFPGGVVQVLPYSITPTRDIVNQVAVSNLNVGNRVAVRRYDDNLSGWTDWQEIYTSAVLNVNEFGGVSADSVVATGYAYSAAGVVFFLPINSYSKPSSVTLTGAFDVASATSPTGSAIASGITVGLQAYSSNKVAAIAKSGLSGFTAGQPLVLRQNSSTSKITVNF